MLVNVPSFVVEFVVWSVFDIPTSVLPTIFVGEEFVGEEERHDVSNE